MLELPSWDLRCSDGSYDDRVHGCLRRWKVWSNFRVDDKCLHRHLRSGPVCGRRLNFLLELPSGDIWRNNGSHNERLHWCLRRWELRSHFGIADKRMHGRLRRGPVCSRWRNILLGLPSWDLRCNLRVDDDRVHRHLRSGSVCGRRRIILLELPSGDIRVVNDGYHYQRVQGCLRRWKLRSHFGITDKYMHRHVRSG